MHFSFPPAMGKCQERLSPIEFSGERSNYELKTRVRSSGEIVAYCASVFLYSAFPKNCGWFCTGLNHCNQMICAGCLAVVSTN